MIQESKPPVYECGHVLGQHIPDPNQLFAWPCRACTCREYREVRK